MFETVVERPETDDEREARSLTLAEGGIARYWRRRSCVAIGGALLPRLATGSYFAVSGAELHWLDAPEGAVAKALAHELAQLSRRFGKLLLRHTTGSDDQAQQRAGLKLLAQDLGDRLRERRQPTVDSQRFHKTVAHLVRQADQGHSRTTRRVAHDALAGVFSLALPDGRAQRPRRRAPLSPSRQKRLEALRHRVKDLAEDQVEYQASCAQLDQTTLPPPLRSRTS